MKSLIPALGLLALVAAPAGPAAADEFTDVLDSAREAYDAGDVTVR